MCLAVNISLPRQDYHHFIGLTFMIFIEKFNQNRDHIGSKRYIDLVQKHIYANIFMICDGLCMKFNKVGSTLSQQVNELTLYLLQVVTKVHCCLRDLCMLLQTSARMVGYYSGATFVTRFSQTEKIVQR